jgi:hypothetical protein
MNSKQINDKVKNIGPLMSLESKKNIVGSVNIKRNFITRIMIYLKM